MRCLTVQQPWAWCIFHGKDIENRTQLWSYRGPLAIHAGARMSMRGAELIPGLLETQKYDMAPAERLTEYTRTVLDYGAILGVVNLVDAHRRPEAGDCCDSVWAERGYLEHRGGTTRVRHDIVHLVLADPVLFEAPVRGVRGALGLWTPDPDLSERIQMETAFAA